MTITPAAPGKAVDAIALVHLYLGLRTINGAPGDVPFAARPAPPSRFV